MVRLLTAVLTTALALAGLVALTTATAPSAHAAAGAISGKITAAGTGTPLAGMTVVAFCNEDGDWYWCDEVTSGTGGTYAFDLPAGTYHVGVYSDDNQYAAAFFGGTDEVNAAAVVPPASDIDLAMQQNATVKGKAGQGALNLGIANVNVCLYQQVTYEGETWWNCVGYASTGTNGTYSAYAAPGTYRVGFSTDDNRWREVYYANAATIEAGTDVVVTAAGRTGISVKMVANAKVTGKVTGKVTAQGTNAAIGGAQVMAYQLVHDGDDSYWDWNYGASADTNGNYEIYLAPGTYRFGFDNACNDDGPCQAIYRREFWNDKLTVETADDVTVPSSGTVANISAVLARNAKITGTVTAEDGGAAIAHADVSALQQVTEEYDGETYTYWDQVSYASANAAGEYQLYVPPGTYRVSFDDGCDETCEDLYQTEYWEETADLETADDVVVAGSATYSGRNGTLAKNGAITGAVTAEAGGAPLEDIMAVAFDPVTYQADGETYTDWNPVAFAHTAADGTYLLRAAPGKHRIGFFQFCGGADCRYLGEFYDDAATIEDAADVTITGPDATTSGIDAALSRGSLISGTLTDEAHAPLADAEVLVYADGGDGWEPVNGNYSDDDGHYAVLVPDGSFRVGFSSDEGAFTDEYYDDSRTLEGADTIAVAGADRPHVDAVLGLSLANEAAPSITDADPRVGEKISVDPGTWSATPDAFTYRWFQAGTATPIGTGKDLVVPAGALGKELTVEVTATKAGWADAVASSAATVPVAPGDLTVTTEPTMSGALTVGSTVHAFEGVWSATPDAFTYRWFQAGTATPIGTGKDLVVPAGALGKELTVEVTATKAGYADGVATSLPSAAVAAGGNANTARPTITGNLQVGATVEAVEGTWSATPDAFTYRWFRSDRVDPIGTGKQLVIPPGVAGKKLFVEITAKAAGYGDSTAYSAPTDTVALGELTATVAPSFGGTAQVGKTLSVQDGTWSPTPDIITYAWFVEGSSTGFWSQQDMTVPAGLAGTKLTVEVTVWKGGYANAVRTLGPITVAPGVLTNTVPPKVTGALVEGQTVQASDGTWGPKPDGYTYRWLVSGSTDPVGTGRTLVIPQGTAGKKLTVEVTAAKTGYSDGVATSVPLDVAAAAAAAPVNTAPPTLSGKVKVGSTLTVDPGSWTPTPTTFQYHWYADGKELTNVTGTRLTLTPALLHKRIEVLVGALVPDSAFAWAQTERTAPVALGTFAVTGKPALKGKAKVGKRLKVVVPAAPAGVTVKVQWLLGKKPISRATATSLKLAKSYRGKVVRARVTYTRPGYAPVAQTVKVRIR
ncbi:hypothetical protein ACFQ3F_21055 [Nocardioides ginsengisoli]|uniref:Alpha-amylase n=1 Tax=Nocardioides ginsengisoli TaxID=363868 RepID=A0ABW3W4P1_9ACTN